MHSFLRKTAGSNRQILLTDFNHFFIDLNHIDMLDGLIAKQFPDGSAVSGTDYQYLFDVWIGCHGDMSYHIMIDELVLLRNH